MKTIAFSNNEIKELIKFYEDQLEKTKQKLETIDTIIQKLNKTLETEGSEGSSTKTEIETSIIDDKAKIKNQEEESREKSHEIKKESSPSEMDFRPKESSQESEMKSSTKRAKTQINLKKLDWRNFFINTLKNENHLMSITEFSSIAYEHFKLHGHKPKNVNYKIRSELNKLVNEGILYKERIKGIKGYAYGFPGMFKKTADTNENTSHQKEADVTSQSSGAADTTAAQQETQSETSKETEEETKPKTEFPDFTSKDFILQVISDAKKPLIQEDIEDKAVEEFYLSRKERRKATKIIEKNLHELFYHDKKINKYLLPKAQIPAYGLPDMFTEEGDLKDTYKNLVNEID